MNTNKFEDLEKSRNVRRLLSKIGFALFLSGMVVWIILNIVVYISKTTNFVELDSSTVLFTFANFLITYPLIYIMLKNETRQCDEKTDFSKKDLFKIFLVCMFISYVGSLVGSILSYVLSRGVAEDPVSILISGGDLLLNTLVMCVFAPIFEELIFRKLFVDIIAPYGEEIAVIFSAFCFALVHGNFFQIFYAFGLGLVFGYVYVKSKKVKNTIILHSCHNFVGGVLPMLLIRKADIQETFIKINNLFQSNLDIPKELICIVFPFIIYLFIRVIMIITGLIVFLKERKKFTMQECDYMSPQKKYFVMFFNIGTILFTINSISSIVLSFVK